MLTGFPPIKNTCGCENVLLEKRQSLGFCFWLEVLWGRCYETSPAARWSASKPQRGSEALLLILAEGDTQLLRKKKKVILLTHLQIKIEWVSDLGTCSFCLFHLPIYSVRTKVIQVHVSLPENGSSHPGLWGHLGEHIQKERRNRARWGLVPGHMCQALGGQWQHASPGLGFWEGIRRRMKNGGWVIPGSWHFTI